MIAPDARAESIAWVRRALTAQLRQAPALRSRAENLVAEAENAGLPIEMLVAWIQSEVPGKQWSAAEFRRYAAWVKAHSGRQQSPDGPWSPRGAQMEER